MIGSRQEKKRRPAKTAFRNAELTEVYRLLTFLQAPCGFLFWLTEQRKARWHDRIANERNEL